MTRRSLFWLSLFWSILLLSNGEELRPVLAAEPVTPAEPATPVEPLTPIVATLISEPLTLPLDLALLQPGAIPADSTVVSSRLANQVRPTVPSLWWAQEQFGDSLLMDWLAYSGNDGTPKRVDFVVNNQAWSIYTYLERYTFTNHMGVSAADYGYNSRVFNSQGQLLAAYICNFGGGYPTLGEARIEQCTVFLPSDPRASLTGRPRPGAGSATPGGTRSP